MADSFFFVYVWDSALPPKRPLFAKTLWYTRFIYDKLESGNIDKIGGNTYGKYKRDHYTG